MYCMYEYKYVLRTYVCIYMYVYMYECVNARTYTYVCMYKCMKCKYVCMNECMNDRLSMRTVSSMNVSIHTSTLPMMSVYDFK